jgi:hypothetical protein
MMQWSDFVITAVRHAQHGGITELEVRPDNGTSIGQGTEWSRAQVIEGIERGTTFVTAFVRDGRWHRGAQVHVVRVGIEKYLRTDRDAIRADNLGALPELPSRTFGVWR